MGLLRSLCRGDKVVWIIFFALCVISLLEVFSATSTLTYKTANHWAPFTGHCTHLLIGLGTVLVVHRLPYRWFRYGWTAAFPIFALVLCYLTMSGMLVNGAARWGEVFGTRVQPSEFAKISVIVVVSTLLMLHKNAGFRSKNTFWYILVMVGTMCLLIFRENLSTAVILFGTVFCMMFIGKIPSGQMLKLSGVCLAVAGLFLAVVFLSPEDSDSGVLHRFSVWKDRVIDFVTPIDCDARDYVITDDNRQTSHASIAIASSNVVGCMPGNSVQRDFLAQAYSDFIYAIIIEELGPDIADTRRAYCAQVRQGFPGLSRNGTGHHACHTGRGEHGCCRWPFPRDGADLAPHQPRRVIDIGRQPLHRHDTERQPQQ